jgi:hypothetical protein
MKVCNSIVCSTSSEILPAVRNTCSIYLCVNEHPVWVIIHEDVSFFRKMKNDPTPCNRKLVLFEVLKVPQNDPSWKYKIFDLTWPDLTWPDLTWPDLTWPNLPQARPIEEFWAILSRKIYNNGWEAQNEEQLRRRISRKIREIDAVVVQRMMQRVRGKLRQIENNGPLSIIWMLFYNKNS